MHSLEPNKIWSAISRLGGLRESIHITNDLSSQPKQS